MHQISNFIDVIVVKYTYSETDQKCYDQFMEYLYTVPNITIHLHDNTENNIGLVKARNELIQKCTHDVVCFTDFDILPVYIDWDAIRTKLCDQSVGIISPITTKFSSVNKSLIWQFKEYLACNMMFTRLETIKKINLFDENFFVAYADWDFIKRIQLNNLSILQHNLSTINHFGLARYRPNKSTIWKKDFNTYIKKWGNDGVLNRSKK